MTVEHLLKLEQNQNGMRKIYIYIYIKNQFLQNRSQK